MIEGISIILFCVMCIGIGNLIYTLFQRSNNTCKIYEVKKIDDVRRVK